MTIALLTLGCKLNYAETSTYERAFISAGLQVVPWNKAADIYLVNTCSVTATSDSKSRNLIRKLHRINPKAILVVTGCSAELRRSEIERIEGVSRVFGAHEKCQVVAETLKLAGINWNADALPLAEKLAQKEMVFSAFSSGERTRSFLKVQDGCDNYCAYCTVPYARGNSRNVSIAECVANARKIAALGIKEIVLTGVNTGDFGRSTGESFLDLIKALNEVEGIERYRISSIEPNLLTDEIVDWIASGTKFQKHFHIPLQSGCDDILAKMGRKYDTAFFAQRIEYLRSKLEHAGESKVFIGIDLMVGLPGETDEHFKRSKAFIEQIHPSFIHLFPYSKRSGTPAASFEGQVEEAEKHHRLAIMEELCSRLSTDFRQEHIGIKENVLWESSCRAGYMEGYTGNYLRVRKPFNKALVNTITEEIL